MKKSVPLTSIFTKWQHPHVCFIILKRNSLTWHKPSLLSPSLQSLITTNLVWLNGFAFSVSTNKFKHALCYQLFMVYFTYHGGFRIYSHCTLDHYDRHRCSIIHIQHNWLTHSSVDVYLACFPTWFLVNSVIVNIHIYTVTKLLFFQPFYMNVQKLNFRSHNFALLC